MLIGYLIAYKKVLDAGDIVGISRFVFNIAIPVLLFNALSHLELPANINWQFLFSYYFVVLIIYALGIWSSKRWFACTLPEQGILGMGSAYSNLVLVGLPVISAGLGDEALLPLLMLVSVHSAILFFIVTMIVEGGNGNGRSLQQITSQMAKSLARNPIIIGLTGGLLVNLLHLPIPKPLNDTLSVLSQATLPCALFVLGASLNSYKIAGHFAEAWTVVGLKMVLQPFLVWVLAFWVFHLDPLWGAVAVMAAGMPIGINVYMISQKYQVGVAVISTAVLLSTVVSVVSQSLLLALFL